MKRLLARFITGAGIILLLSIVVFDPQLVLMHHNQLSAATINKWNGITIGQGAGSVATFNGKAMGESFQINGVTVPAKSVTVNTLTVDWGTAVTSGSTGTITQTFTNNGPWIITPTVSRAGTTAPFTHTNDLGTTMAPGGTGTVRHVFSPTTTAAQTMTWTLNW